MKKLLKTFGENLEQFQLAKLKRKYEELGYKFYEGYSKIKKGERFVFDAYARHLKTKDEIIFEIKSKDSIKRGDTEKILIERDRYLAHFPKARFILVLAQEHKQPQIFDSELNHLLEKYIQDTKSFFLKKNIKEFDRVESTTDLSITKVDFKNFLNIEISGYGNLKFWLKIEDEQFSGQALSDGIPFEFYACLKHNRESSDYIYKLEERTEITFDLSEFK